MITKQSTVRTLLVGPVLDADGVAKTDEVVASIKITKNGTVGAADGSATLTHDHAGKYKLALTANDTDTLGVLEISLNSGTNDMPIVRFNVVPANVFDSLVGGSDVLQADLTQILGVAQSATDLKDFADTGYDPSTHVAQSDMTYIHGTALTETAGQLAGRFTDFFDQAAAGYTVGTALSSFKATGFSTHAAADVWTAYGNEVLYADLRQILGHAITQTGTQVADGFEHFFNHATPAITVGDAMRGTDGANTTVPDAAGTAAGLHTTTDGLIAALNDFDPANDAVANVTLVATCTTNSDMRGTDGANTVVPDAAGTAAGLHATTDGLIGTAQADLDTITGTGGVLIGTDVMDRSGTLDVNMKTATATALDLILKDSTFALALADAVWDEVLTAATHNVATSAGRRLRDIGAFAVISGTATGGTSETITLNGDASATASIYNQSLIVITGGTGVGQTRMIINYTAGKVATVDRPWEVTPINADSEYAVIAFSGILMADHGVAQAGAASTITLGTTALGVADSYVGCAIYLAAGTGAGQTRLITAYTAGRVATVVPDWETTPDNTSVYKVLPVGRSIVESLGVNAAAQIEAEATDALNAYDPPTNTEFEARTIPTADYFDPVNDTVANVTTVGTVTNAVVTDAASRTASKADVSALATIRAVTDKLDTTLVLDGVVYDFTAAALAAAPSGAGGDATEANQTAIIAHLTAIKGAGWVDENLTTMDALIDAIKAKTDGLNFTGDDVKATLDSEEVTPTDASKTGYALSATGLDAISADEPTAKPTTFAGWIMWLVQRFRRSKLTSTTLTVEQEDGTAVTEQTVSDDDTTQQLGPPT